MQRFISNEAGYLDWLKANGNGFVVNSRIEIDATYLVLHRSNCWTINAGKTMCQELSLTARIQN